MAKSETPKKKTATRKPKAAPAPKPAAAPEVSWQRRLGQEMAALLLLGLAGFFLLALLSHTPADPRGSWPCGRPRRSTTPRARPGRCHGAGLVPARVQSRPPRPSILVR